MPTAKKAPEGAGDIWTWVGLDADSKLAVSWHVGDRDSEAAKIFINDLAKRLSNRVQLTSDGHKAYLEAVEGAFGADIDYATLVKVYGEAPEGQRRYSPAVCTGAHKHPIEGKPDPKHYNFVRIHQTLKITPVIPAEVTPKLWEMPDMVKVLEDWEAATA